MTARADVLLTDPIIGRLRGMRMARGWSLAAAAKQVGMSIAAVGSYERGEREPPFTTGRVLLDAYGYDLVAVSPEHMVVPLRQGESSAWAEWCVVLPDSTTVIAARDQGEARLIHSQIPYSALAHRVHRISPLVR